MEENKNRPDDKAAENREDNTTDINKEEHADKKKKGGIHNNAIYAASMGRSATSHVDPHSNRGYADTGTNISYEGPTAPGSGGSVGSGYSSGRSAADPEPRTDSDYDRARVEHGHKQNNENSPEDRKDEEGQK